MTGGAGIKIGNKALDTNIPNQYIMQSEMVVDFLLLCQINPLGLFVD